MQLLAEFGRTIWARAIETGAENAVTDFVGRAGELEPSAKWTKTGRLAESPTIFSVSRHSVAVKATGGAVTEPESDALAKAAG